MITTRADDVLNLPPGAEALEIAFLPLKSAGPDAWMEMGDLARTQAVVQNRTPISNLKALGISSGHLVLVMIPHAGGENGEFVAQLQSWLEQEPPAPGFLIRSLLLTLQGATLLWRPNRMIVLAPRERLETVCRSLVEASFHEAELRSLEQTIDAGWEQVEADAPLAFEFDKRSLHLRAALSQRFQTVLSLRARYARLAPHVLVPHVHPPTLASQIGERHRERTRMEDRLELLNGKLEALERIYELCSHRVSEFMVARTGHHLEWVIIVLLFAQSALLVIEFLSRLSE